MNKSTNTHPALSITVLLTTKIVKFFTKSSDQRERGFGSGAEAPIGWRPCRSVLLLLFAITLGLFAPESAEASVVVIGHRGNSDYAPENTLSAISAAIGTAWGVESDPRVTSDGQILMMHDTTVNRTTDGAYTGAIENMTFAQARTLDAGSWFGSEFAGEQVPTLLESVILAKNAGMISCLDVKSGPASTYVTLLQPYKADVEIHSFSESFLSDVNTLDPGGFTLVLLGGGNLESAVPSIPSYVDRVSWNNGGITAAGVQAAHAAGKQVYAWTVNNPTTMLALEAMGVDGIVTNDTPLAYATLDQTPPDPDELPNPVLQYKFEGNLNNTGSGGATYNGTLAGTNGIMSYVSGPLASSGQAMDLAQGTQPVVDGQRVEVDYIMPDDGTITFWAKCNDFFNYAAYFDSNINGDDWEMWTNIGGAGGFRIADNSSRINFNIGIDGDWDHFAMSWHKNDNNTVDMNLYLDGEPVAGTTGIWIDPGTKFAIGGGLLNTAGSMTFDDFRIYDVTLTPEQIASLLPQPGLGDANGDGWVDEEDAKVLAANWLASGKEWADGDFNEDGLVNHIDVTIMAANWNPQPLASVPEPGSIVLLLGACLSIMSLRRRKRSLTVPAAGTV